MAKTKDPGNWYPNSQVKGEQEVKDRHLADAMAEKRSDDDKRKAEMAKRNKVAAEVAKQVKAKEAKAEPVPDTTDRTQEKWDRMARERLARDNKWVPDPRGVWVANHSPKKYDTVEELIEGEDLK